MTEIRVCEYCNKEFKFEKFNRLKERPGRFCSLKCCNESSGKLPDVSILNNILISNAGTIQLNKLHLLSGISAKKIRKVIKHQGFRDYIEYHTYIKGFYISETPWVQ